MVMIRYIHRGGWAFDRVSELLSELMFIGFITGWVHLKFLHPLMEIMWNRLESDLMEVGIDLNVLNDDVFVEYTDIVAGGVLELLNLNPLNPDRKQLHIVINLKKSQLMTRQVNLLALIWVVLVHFLILDLLVLLGGDGVLDGAASLADAVHLCDEHFGAVDFGLGVGEEGAVLQGLRERHPRKQVV